MSNDAHDLEAVIKSRFPIITIETHEETRVVELLKRMCLLNEWPMFAWNVVDGLARQDLTDERVPETYDLDKALRHINRSPQNGIFLLLDIHPFLNDPLHVRLLKNIAQDYHSTPRTLVLVGHSLKIPAELQRMNARFEMTMPNAADVRGLVNEELQLWQRRNKDRKLGGSQRALQMMVRHLTGLCEEDVRRLARHAIQHDDAITVEDIERIQHTKYDMLNQDSLLSLELDTCGIDELGGLDALKKWLTVRETVFVSEQAPELDTPKGVLLLGVQGSGKSLSAKCIAGSWKLPLLRMDFGVLYNKFFGETERNLRQALDTADALAPCVLWIDEIEKGMNASDSSMDGGVSQRVLGTLLTWMSERKTRVFMVATANDIKALPPELMRKGRFDEIFFVDLPEKEIREDIFRIHLTRRKLRPENFDIGALSVLSKGFSGAEIEQAIVAALYQAYSEKRDLATEHVLDELNRTRPLSVVMAESVQQLRHWAAERAVPAH